MSENEIKPVAVLCETATGRYWSTNVAVHCLPLGDYYDQSAIDRLTAERDAAERQRDGYIEQHCRDSAELRAVCAERDEAERKLSVAVAEGKGLVADAERYRWLVDSGRFCPSFYNKGWGLRSGAFERSTKESLDAAIDAARAEGGV